MLLPQRVWEAEFLGRPAIVKQRFSKQYRHPALDAKLTMARLKQVTAAAACCGCVRLIAGALWKRAEHAALSRQLLLLHIITNNAAVRMRRRCAAC